jgi:DNA-directed RNA polymerase subunit RPC12/RpoP
MKCTNCDHEVSNSAIYCGSCGHKLIIEDPSSTMIENKSIPQKKKRLLGLWIGLGSLFLIILMILLGSIKTKNTPNILPSDTSLPKIDESIYIIETSPPQKVTVEQTSYTDSLLLPSTFTQYTGILKVEVVEHFSNLPGHEWNFSDNASIVTEGTEKIFEIPGVTGLKGFFCSPELTLNHGILTKFKMAGTSHLMEFFMFQNQWNDPDYKRFGGAIYQTNQMETTIWEGTDNSQSNQVMMGNLLLKPDNWYGLFVGGTDTGDFIFLVWNLENPNAFVIKSLEKGELWATGLWITCFQVGEGDLYLDDYSIVNFDG